MIKASLYKKEKTHRGFSGFSLVALLLLHALLQRKDGKTSRETRRDSKGYNGGYELKDNGGGASDNR